MNKWYVLHVKTGNEHDTTRWIKKFLPNTRFLVPQRELKERHNGKWETVVKDVFPSYVFINVEMDVNNYYKLTSIPYLIRILGNDKTPEAVPESEMELVFMLAGVEGSPLSISNVLVEGTKIEVVSGPLIGFAGKVIKIEPRRFRAKVLISLMGEDRIIELGINVVKKIN